MTRRVQVTGGPAWARGKVGELYGEIHDIGLYDVLVPKQA